MSAQPQTLDLIQLIDARIEAYLSERQSAAPPAPVEERTYSQDEFCQLVGISRDTAWRLRKAGKLPFIQSTTRTVRYTQRHVDDFLRSKERNR